MGRRSHKQRLQIWMNGVPVGIWERAQVESLTYFDDWIQDEQGRPLSLSLPFLPANASYKGRIVTDFFDNLLPDSDAIRRRLAQRYRTGGVTPFELLAVLGRDCVGALQLLEEGDAPVDLTTINGRALSEAEVARLLRDTTSAAPLGAY